MNSQIRSFSGLAGLAGINLPQNSSKSQEAIQKAQELAMLGQQQAIETGHILKALFYTDDPDASGVISYALKKVNANTNLIIKCLI